MFIDLLDHLRCPVDHAESWLVAAIDQMAGRYVQQASLGCPVCQSTYQVRDFVAHFAPERARPLRQLQLRDDNAVLRLAALLDLRAPGGFVGVSGEWAHYAAPLALAYDIQSVVLDRTALPISGDAVSVLLVAEFVPIAAGALRGILLDSDPTLVESAVRAVGAGGRVVGPVSLPVPAGVEELARDDVSWVGERKELSFVPLARVR